MHIGFGFGIRNVEGEMILEIADALNFVGRQTLGSIRMRVD